MVSNRVIDFNAATQAGGVSVAIYDALTRHKGFWFGWNGQVDETENATPQVAESGGHKTVTISLTPDDYNEFYLGYSNSVLWPVLHNRLDLAQFEAGYYARYMSVNEKFASTLAPLIEPDDVIWIHDYHLVPMALELRKLGIDNPIGFFLHIPVGPAQSLLAIPEHKALARALSAYDLVGLQTQSDVRNLMDFLQQSVFGRLLPSGRMRVFDAELDISCFPVGITPSDFATPAADLPIETPEISRIIGIDRLDYTKGLPQKFRAFGKFLEEFPEHRRKIGLSQFAPPTRESVEAYADIRAELEALSGAINGRFGELDWVPINYIHRPMPRAELRDVYRSSRIGWVTPLMDGMNLVSKEYVASQDPADPGVLILSMFAGAAEQLRDAVLVNPYDPLDMVQALHTAIEMPLDERIARNAKLARTVAKGDSITWSNSYYRSLTKAGQRRIGKVAPSARMTDALKKLSSTSKKKSSLKSHEAHAEG
ncbi:alpha,alpha-trehalose-phosphate synthase [Hyphomicrobium methylovorum]|nr:trehalose-6-phosphate synthase [Hyphomicrobium methylovorum]MBA2127616.1 alpha,alpha-trehalose-phosphate synthase [Hyphomicrobium methylovorum]